MIIQCLANSVYILVNHCDTSQELTFFSNQHNAINYVAVLHTMVTQQRITLPYMNYCVIINYCDYDYELLWCAPYVIIVNQALLGHFNYC